MNDESIRDVLKSYFRTGNRPTAEQFEQLIDEVVAMQDDEIYIDDDTKNVGLGITSPCNKLDVNGSVAIGDQYAGKKEASPKHSLLVQGRVGVGKKNPTEALDVEGTIRGNDFYSEGKAEVRSGIVVGSDYVKKESIPKNGLIVQGKVGIGVLNPDEALTVDGTVRADHFISTDKIEAFGGIKVGNTQQADGAGTIRWTGEDLEVLDKEGQWQSLTSQSGESVWLKTSSGDISLAKGKVGIGINQPKNKFDVSGNLSIGYSNNNIAEAPASGLLVKGNVGIGKSPKSGAKLDVEGAIHAKALYINGQSIEAGSGDGGSGVPLSIPVSEVLVEDADGKTAKIEEYDAIKLAELSKAFVIKFNSAIDVSNRGERFLEIVYDSPYTFTPNFALEDAFELPDSSIKWHTPLKLRCVIEQVDPDSVRIKLADDSFSFIQKSLTHRTSLKLAVRAKLFGNSYSDWDIEFDIQPTFEFQMAWGGLGYQDGKFVNPQGIAVFKNSVYVVDQYYHNIQKFSIEGEFQKRYGNRFMLRENRWNLKDIATDSKKRVFVSDSNNNTILVYNKNGTLVQTIGKRGTYGGEFDYNGPTGIFIDQNDHLYATDRRRIIQFDAEGEFVANWSLTGFDLGENTYYELKDVVVDRDGNVYTSDGNEVYVFDADRAPKTQWPISTYNYSGTKLTISNDTESQIIYASVQNHLSKYALDGTKDDTWTDALSNTYIQDSLIDSNNNLIALQTNGNIIKVNSDGAVEETLWDNTTVPTPIENPTMLALCDTSNFMVISGQSDKRINKVNYKTGTVAMWEPLGSGLGYFNQPKGIDIDTAGTVYIADMQNHRIQKLKDGASTFTAWGSEGSGEGFLSEPVDVAVSKDKKVYVAESGNKRIQIFTEEGNSAGFLEHPDLDADSIDKSLSIAAYENVYVADAKNKRVLKFGLDGKFSEWKIDDNDDLDNILEFERGLGISVDENENVYLYLWHKACIKIYNSSGEFLGRFGSLGLNDGEVITLAGGGVAVDKAGENVYVADTHRVQKFRNHL